MGKTSKQTQTQEIDPQVAANSAANMGLARLFASLGFAPYTGNDVAAFTPQQAAAFEAQQGASEAFGMPSGFTWDETLPETTTDATGIVGYSTHDLMRRAIGEERYTALEQFLRGFSDTAARTPKAKKKKSSSGGKK